MNADRRLEDLFYSCVRMGLREDEVFQGGADVPLQAETWDALFETARLQAVSGIFVEGVSRSGTKPGRETWLRWLGHLMQLRGANMEAARKGEEWLGRLREVGMEAEVFKGTSVGRWYPDPLARCCGDVDIVVYCITVCPLRQGAGCDMIGRSGALPPRRRRERQGSPARFSDSSKPAWECAASPCLPPEGSP